jgi:hypothetical protein
MLFIGALISLEAWPVYRLIVVQTAGGTPGLQTMVSMALSFLLVVALNVLVLFVPIRVGLKRLLAREI